MTIHVQCHANVRWRIHGHDLNRSFHEGMKDISNVTIHLKTHSGNINITRPRIYGQNLDFLTLKRDFKDVLCHVINRIFHLCSCIIECIKLAKKKQ